MLASLARQARESSRQPRASSNDDTIYWPGYHDLDGVTFNLHCPLISYADSSILGSASTLSILALVSNGINLGSVFINENQHLLKVTNQFTKDGDVIFYNVTIQQPFEVFTNLQIRSNGKSNKSVPEKMVRAEKVDVQWPKIKYQNVKLQWEGPVPKLVKCAEGLDIGVAANLDVLTSAEWQVRGLSDVKLDVNVELAGKVRTSFKHVHGPPLVITSPQISQCERSFQITRTVAGFGLTGRTEICLIAQVKYVGQITREMILFDYFRDWGVELRRSGTFTGKSTKFAKPKVEVRKNLPDGTGVGWMISDYTGANLGLFPNIEIFGKMTMEIGRDSWETKVGLSLDLRLTLSAQSDQCPIPYFSRWGTFSVSAFWSTGELNLFGAKVVSPDSDRSSFKSSSDLPRGCLFGRRISDPKSKLREIDVPTSKSKTQVVEFKRKEANAILRFSGLPNDVSAGNCYALVTLGDLTPLAEAIQLGDVTWAIRLERGDMKESTLRLPVYRKSKEAMKSRDIALLHVFWAPGGLFCNESDERIAIGQDLKVGCIEPSLYWEAISVDWVALDSDFVAWSAVGSRTPVNGNYLQLFDLPKAPNRPKEVYILRSKYYLGPDTVSIVVLSKFALLFTRRKLPLVVFAPDATGVDFYSRTSRDRVSPLSQGSPVFQHLFDVYGSYIRFVATTNDRTMPFRVFTISVGALTLFEYSNPDGVVHFHGIGTGTKFEPGFSLQLARRGTVAEVYKTWGGAKPTETVFETPGEITIHLIHRDTGSWELGATFHDPQSKKSKEIPWGLHKYIENPVAFFESLGIPKGERTNKYTVDQVEMTTQGLIRLKADIAIDRVKLKKANILELLDLTPKEARVKYPFQEGRPGAFRDMEDDALEQETSHGLEADMALTIEIVAGAFGGALIVGLIGLVVYRRRSKSKAKSSSEILDECSSDEVIREGLTERVE